MPAMVCCFLCIFMSENESYQAFNKWMLEEVKKGLGEGYDIELLNIPQINGGSRDGLRVKKGGVDMSPVIITDHYFEQYYKGCKGLDDIVKEILERYRLGGDVTEVEADGEDCFDSVRGRIIYRLINLSRNKQFLTNVPFFEYLDFAIVFYILDGANVYGEALICDSHLERWGVNKEELMLLARENTPRLCCAQIKTLNDVIDKLEEEIEPVESISSSAFQSPYYMLTNAFGWYGAVCILYDGVLKNLADSFEKDLILLPSSFHEFLILPYDPEEADINKQKELVKFVNYHYLPAEDYLSDEIYLYRRQTDTVELWEGKEQLLS